MDNVTRVGVSFDPELLTQFDAVIKTKGYRNRSKAICDLVRKALIDWTIEAGTSEVIGTLTILYDHHKGDVTNQLLHIQHHHHTDIPATTHIHVDEKNCLEILVVKGRADDVRELADAIIALKGVKHGELVITKVP